MGNAETVTALDLIARQLQLEEEARQAIPFSFSSCTYAKGYIKQPVYSCKTCGPDVGVCAGCSVSCHSQHDLVELFYRRDFRCDCGKAGTLCTLLRSDEARRNERNRYDKNFNGQFCYCPRGMSYDPETEEDTMFQCLICEDWFHESCLSMSASSSDTVRVPPCGRNAAIGVEPAEGEVDPGQDGSEVDESNSVHNGRKLAVDPEDFDTLICDACARKPENECLLSYAGSSGFLVALPSESAHSSDSTSSKLAAIEGSHDDVAESERAKAGGGEQAQDAALSSGASVLRELDNPSIESSSQLDGAVVKRKAEDTPDADGDGAVLAKRARGGPNSNSANSSDGSGPEQSCSRPQVLPMVHAALAVKPRDDTATGRLDLYLESTFRDKLCRCKNCLHLVSDKAYLMEEEEQYVPEEDSDAGKSTFDLGVAALARIPRDRALDAVHEYQSMREDLMAFLAPFARQGKVIEEKDIQAFFEERRAQQQQQQSRA